jgi:hypothetical protein
LRARALPNKKDADYPKNQPKNPAHGLPPKWNELNPTSYAADPGKPDLLSDQARWPANPLMREAHADLPNPNAESIK